MSNGVKIGDSDDMIRRSDSGKYREDEHERTKVADYATRNEISMAMGASALGSDAHLAQPYGLFEKIATAC
jgi:hypothetical protein